ncbi:unnamed protein product [Ilex paraguariensis]|uniref:Serine aminopeptidase S33 domain-containing protein n=1 Tax=Ilex paraguariensis TaxID=185542 RepID=A0ABC8S0D7_9AQUA
MFSVNVEIDDPAPSHREAATASIVADVHYKTCNCLLGKLWKSNIRRPMILVGPSLGAAVAIDFALNIPDAFLC